MTTATQVPYTIRTVDHAERPATPTGSADDIDSALSAAWALNRHTEAPVEIVFHDRVEGSRVVAVLTLEWQD